ncbi:MAG: hypothetical protein NTW08_04095 [Gammaproteobacteria bacterium]|nr:hypothetical protein [Gammaproteobacteria bacterium]
MLDLFTYPNKQKSSPAVDLSVLDNMILWVKQSGLPSTTQESAIKIIENLRWVKVNQAQIKEFVDHKDLYLPGLPEGDRENWVVRDHMGTSLHFNSYANGDHASRDLLQIVQSFEETFTTLESTGKTLALQMFMAKCNYDEHRGCLEARVADAMQFIGQLNSTQGTPRLDDLIQICQLLYFLDIDNDAYNFLMAEQFLSPYYGQAVMQDGKDVILTQEMLFDAIAFFCAYTRPTPEELNTERAAQEQDCSAWQAQIFDALTSTATYQQGQQGMHQYRFTSEDAALQYCNWLRRCDALQLYDIHRCKVKEENGIFIVRLNALQRDMVWNPNKSEKKFLLTQDNHGDSPLHLAIWKRDVQAYTALIYGATRGEIDQALVMKTEFKNTPLHWAAFEESGIALTMLIKKASTSVMDIALFIQNKQGITPLQWVIQHQRKQVLQALFEKLSLAAVDKSLSIKEKGGNILYFAVETRDVNLLTILLSKSSMAIIDKIVAAGDVRENILVKAIQTQNLSILIQIIDKTSPEALGRALSATEVDVGVSFSTHRIGHVHTIKHRLIDFVMKADFEALSIILDRASTVEVDKVLRTSDISGVTPLERIVDRRLNFIALVNKASTELLDELVGSSGFILNILGKSVLRCDLVRCIFERLSPSVIDEILSKKWVNNALSPVLAAAKKDKDFFHILLDRASKKAINTFLLSDDMLLPLLIQHQPRDVCSTLMENISPDVLKKVSAQTFCSIADKLDNKTVLQCIHDMSVASLDIALAFQDKQGRSLLDILAAKQDCACLLSCVKKTSPEARFKALSHMNEDRKQAYIESIDNPAGREAWMILLKLDASHLREDEEQRIPMIQLGNQRSLLLSLDTLDEIVTAVQTHGLASWKDFYILEKFSTYPPSHAMLSRIVELMRKYIMLTPTSIPSAVSDVCQTCETGLLAIKTFSGWKPEAWKGFLSQLKDTSTRAALRKPHSRLTPTHKFYHLTGEIIAYRGKKPRPKVKHQTHAKKQSATLISTHKNTPLFQSQQEETVLVGVVLRVDPNLNSEDSDYNSQKAKIRAMIYADLGTYSRDWVGDKNRVESYRARTKNYILLSEFQEAIKDKTDSTNEILLEPSKGSLLGVVIGRDTPKARKLARQYQAELKTELGLDLPLMLYDAEKKILIENLDLYEANHEKYALETEKSALLKQPCPKAGFFTKVAKYEDKSYASNVVKRLEKIDKRVVELEQVVSKLCAAAVTTAAAMSAKTADLRAQAEAARQLASHTSDSPPSPNEGTRIPPLPR